LGTGAAWRLHRSGFPLLVAELDQPLVVRRTVAFASAVYEGEIAVEGVTAWKARDASEAAAFLRDGIVPVLADPEGKQWRALAPRVLVDAVMAKRNTGTRIDDAALVIGLGPGFTPGADCHCVVETQRGHDLGRALWHRAAAANTGVPGEIGGKSAERVLRAPADGPLTSVRRIGESVSEGDVIARVNGATVTAPFAGVLRGLVHDGLAVRRGDKVGDVDPRANREHCFTIGDKALAVGGGVLEAVLEWMQTAPPVRP
ncbi:MAG: selenium-dependent molybdenum cofactor biosynthesis protein YqeB, partial [Rudaea sp.]